MSCSGVGNGKLAPVPADQAREHPLFLARESRHVGVLQQVRAVLLVLRVRDVQADLVQPRRPREQRLG